MDVRVCHGLIFVVGMFCSVMLGQLDSGSATWLVKESSEAKRK